MKKKHVLLYGDSNTWGADTANNWRYDDDVRWTMQAQALLGEDYLLVPEGLSGRTTVFEDPLGDGMSGLSTLQPIMMSHTPLDLLVVMLGTNDCKERLGASAAIITMGMLRLLNRAKEIKAWGGEPNILLVAPIIIDQNIYLTPGAEGMGQGCAEKSAELPARYEALARENGFHYLDCNPYVTAQPGDFMHFDRDSNTRFAKAIAPAIRKALGK